MAENEKKKTKSENEMNRTRRLASAEHRRQPIEFDIQLRRHSEAGEQNQRRQRHEYSGVSHLLQRIVLAVLRRLFSKAKVIADHRGNLFGVVQGKEKLAQMADGKIENNIEQPVQHKQPAEKKVPAARGRGRIVSRNRQPAREGARRGGYRPVLHTQVARRVYLATV